MFRSTLGHPQANKERTRNNKMSTQWPEDGPGSAETFSLNVNIIDFNTLLS
jgi:hypothetical protein